MTALRDVYVACRQVAYHEDVGDVRGLLPVSGALTCEAYKGLDNETLRRQYSLVWQEEHTRQSCMGDSDGGSFNNEEGSGKMRELYDKLTKISQSGNELLRKLFPDVTAEERMRHKRTMLRERMGFTGDVTPTKEQTMAKYLNKLSTTKNQTATDVQQQQHPVYIEEFHRFALATSAGPFANFTQYQYPMNMTTSLVSPMQSNTMPLGNGETSNMKRNIKASTSRSAMISTPREIHEVPCRKTEANMGITVPVQHTMTKSDKHNRNMVEMFEKHLDTFEKHLETEEDEEDEEESDDDAAANNRSAPAKNFICKLESEMTYEDYKAFGVAPPWYVDAPIIKLPRTLCGKVMVPIKIKKREKKNALDDLIAAAVNKSKEDLTYKDYKAMGVTPPWWVQGARKSRSNTSQTRVSVKKMTSQGARQLGGGRACNTRSRQKINDRRSASMTRIRQRNPRTNARNAGQTRRSYSLTKMPMRKAVGSRKSLLTKMPERRSNPSKKLVNCKTNSKTRITPRKSTSKGGAAKYSKTQSKPTVQRSKSETREWPTKKFVGSKGGLSQKSTSLESLSFNSRVKLQAYPTPIEKKQAVRSRPTDNHSLRKATLKRDFQAKISNPESRRAFQHRVKNERIGRINSRHGPLHRSARTLLDKRNRDKRSALRSPTRKIYPHWSKQGKRMRAHI